jgi:hypothetical protein
MPSDIDDDILQFIQEQEANQNAGQDIEQQLLSLLLNPAETTSKRVRLVDDPDNNIISEVKEAVIVNPAGYLEKIQEETINTATLGDGTPLNSYGICKCMSCLQLVRIENLSRCLCGATTCIMCGRFDAKNNIWYCSRSHKFWGKFLGFFGIGLR